MALILTPLTLRDDPTGRIVAERRYEADGVTFSLTSIERVSPHAIFESPLHNLSLALTQVPKTWWWVYLPGGKRVHVGPLTFVSAGTQVRVSSRAGRHRWIQMRIAPEVLDTMLGKRGGPLPPIPAIRDTPIDSALLRIAREMAQPSQGTQEVIEALKESILIDLTRVIMAPQQIIAARPAGLSSQQLTTLSEYIENADHFAPTIGDIAKLLGISRRHLTRLFRLSTGQTIHAHLSQVRLRKAMHLLTTTQLSVQEIAHKLGFATTGGLTATFRAATGQTPSKYRQSHRAP